MTTSRKSEDPLIHLRDDDHFQSLIHDHEGILVVKCSATWCRPCQKIALGFKKWAASEATNTHLHFAELDMTLNEELKGVAMQCGVKTIPAFLLFASKGRLLKMLSTSNLEMVKEEASAGNQKDTYGCL